MSSTYLVRSLTPHAGLIFALRCLGLALQMIILAVDLERRFLERITLTSLLGETVRLTARGLIASIRLRVLVFLVLIFDITLARAFIELVFLILVFTILVFVFLILISLLFVLLATGITLISFCVEHFITVTYATTFLPSLAAHLLLTTICCE